MLGKVFIVEDETALLYALQAKLKIEGFDTEVADTAFNAVEKIKDFKPDIVLLDILLPRGDGWQILKGLKSDKETKNIPVIILSSLDGSENKKKGIELGAQEYIVKSNYELKYIINRIKKTLKK